MTPEHWEGDDDLPVGWPQTILTIIDRAKTAKTASIAGDYPLPEVAEAILTRGALNFHLWTADQPDDWPNGHSYNSKIHLLQLVDTAVRGLRPDSVTMLNDSYVMRDSAEGVDPSLTSLEDVANASTAHRRLSESRHQGSMHSAWIAGEGAAYDITEAMGFAHVVRTDDEWLIRAWTGGARYVLDGDQITWDRAYASEIDPADSGLIPQTLIDAFSAEDAMATLDSLSEVVFGPDSVIEELLPAAERRHLTDAAVLQHITRRGGIVMIGADADDPELKRLQAAGIVAVNTHHNDRATRRRHARYKR